MNGDILWSGIKKDSHLRLRQPNGVVFHAHIQRNPCVI